MTTLRYRSTALPWVRNYSRSHNFFNNSSALISKSFCHSVLWQVSHSLARLPEPPISPNPPPLRAVPHVPSAKSLRCSTETEVHQWHLILKEFAAFIF